MHFLSRFALEHRRPHTALLGFIVSISPAATVFVEALIPIVLYLSPWPFGFAIGVLFHFLIAVTPPPNNAGGFSVGVLTRYFFFAPEQCARAFDVRPPPSVAAASAATMAFVVAGSRQRDGARGRHRHVHLAPPRHACLPRAASRGR